jgi:hypothetical protein
MLFRRNADGVGDRHFIGTVLLGLLGFAVAGTLWLWPGLLAMWACNRARGEVLESSIDARDLQQIALSVTGAWLAVSGLAGFFSHGLIAVFLREQIQNDVSGALPPGEWHWLIHYAVLMAAGAALMAGARGLVNLLARVRRYPGTDGSLADTGADDAI